jgi:outer membrane receptor protein involved in Fe transport
MFRRKPLSVAVATAIGVVSLGSMLVNPAYAQDQEQAPDAEEDVLVEEVIVTGSRIKRMGNLESPTPMVSLGEDQIEMTGSINVYDILNELPQSGEGFTRGNTNFTVGSSGIQTVNLRGLGSNRTLTLVNGRRWVGGVPGTNIVDLNSIPADLIQRMEVITGGASSVYGSDAVAGVVNIILKDDYEGITLEGMYGQYDEGDGETHAFSLTMGQNFADGRGNAVFHARVDEQGSMFARDRTPQTGRDLFYYGPYYGGTYGAPYDTYIADPSYSSYPPQGRFFVSGSTSDSRGMLTFDCSQRDEDSVLPSDTVVDWAAAGGAAQCGFNRTYHRALEVPLERYNVYSQVTYDLTENHEIFMEISYTSVDSTSEFEPVPFNSEDIFGGLGNRGYHYTNPFVPQEIADAAVAANADNPDWNGEIPFIRRLQEFGNRGSENQRETFRVAFGMEGSFGDIDYDWYYQYGEADRYQASGAYNALNFRSALNAEYDELGNIVCADSADRAAGCVPINVFGMGAISPEAVTWVGYESMRRSINEQQVLGGNLTSSFNFMDRDIGWAVGAEYREEKADDNPDDLQERGLHGGNVVPRTQGEYDVAGAYAEVVIPLVRDVAFMQDLALEAAYRIDDYSTAGSVDAMKLGLNWVINDQFRTRVVYADSVRAPSIDDLFAGQAQTYTSISDPCDGLGTDAESNMDPTVVSNCYSIPDVAATAAAGTYNPDTGQVEDGFFYTQPDIQTISGFIGGNEDLMEENAETWTAGIVWTPPYIEDFALSVDWYSIEIDDVIGNVSATRLINECFESNTFPSTFQCDAHERFPGTGKLRYWYSFGINQSLYKSEGYDVSAAWRLNELPFIPGSLRMSLLWTHRDKHTFQTTSESNPFDYVGEVGYNDDKVKFTVAWEAEKWLVSFDNTWYGDSLDDVSQGKNDYHLNDLGTINYLDMQVRYFPNEDWQFYVGVDNLLDEDPPYCPSCNNEPTPGAHYSGGQYRPWGSLFYYGGIKYTFGR